MKTLRLCPRASTPSGAVFRCTWRRPGAAHITIATLHQRLRRRRARAQPKWGEKTSPVSLQGSRRQYGAALRQVVKERSMRCDHRVEKAKRPGNLSVFRAAVGRLHQAPGVEGRRLGDALPRKDGVLKLRMAQRASRGSIDRLPCSETGARSRAAAEAGACADGGAGFHDEALRIENCDEA